MVSQTGLANIQGFFYSNTTGIPSFVIPTGYVLVANGDSTASWATGVQGPTGPVGIAGLSFSGVATGLTTFQPANAVGTPITTAVVNSQIFTTKIGSGGFTGIIATIPLYGASGTTPSPATGMTELDVQTTMVSVAPSNDAARFKYSWQIVGIGTALATPLGNVISALAVGTNGTPTSAAVPSGWNTTAQLDINKNNILLYASIPSGTVDVKSNVMWGFSK